MEGLGKEREQAEGGDLLGRKVIRQKPDNSLLSHRFKVINCIRESINVATKYQCGKNVLSNSSLLAVCPSVQGSRSHSLL